MRKSFFALPLAALLSVSNVDAFASDYLVDDPESSNAPAETSAEQSTGVIYYVSAAGSGRANGLSASSPKKDLQAILNAIKDKGENGATVRVAEGNYLGNLDAGYIEINNFITLEGGWNSTFTERDPLKYQTKIEPTQQQLGTNAGKGLITIKGLDNINYKVGGTLKIDGFMLNMGFENNYKPANPKDERNGCPEGCETGRMLDDPGSQPEHQIIKGEGAIAGNVIICNCLIANATYFGIQFNSRCGKIEIYNNVIISNRYGGVRIDGWSKDGTQTQVDFHHNTVAFNWCRDKLMTDMGYGYEFMNKVNADVHHNIFACNNYAALARTRALSGPDAKIEAKKVTNVFNNCFFMNAADLQLPGQGGGKWLNVACKDFENVDEKILPKYEGNMELKSGDSFVNTLDQAYLKGFATLKVVSSSSFDANSAANQFRQAMGMNMRGTEVNRVSMYGNRYNYEKSLKLFGAKQGYGAQKVK